MGKTAGHRTGPDRQAESSAGSNEPALAIELDQALEEDTLAVYYQPIVAANGALLAAEALVRWPHPTRGLLGPETILTCAAQAGLELALDQWVLHTATHHAATWPRTPRHTVPVSVNLSALAPGHPALGTTIESALAASGLPGGQLILELVEHSLPTSLAQARHAMQHLTHTGIRWALDDFGTGFSNLARLKHLPVELLKLDRTLTTDLAGPADIALVHATTTMANAHDCTVIAEGIETHYQLAHLQTLGIPAYQGWLFAPAVPAHELHDYLPG